MSSRESILAAVARNQPPKTDLPDITSFDTSAIGSLDDFTAVLTGIGGTAYHIKDLSGVDAIITEVLGTPGRVVNLVDGLKLSDAEEVIHDVEVHELHNVDLAIIKANFGVAENGAVWVTEDSVQQRALPFICQHLAVVIHQNEIVSTMHQAYARLNNEPQYNYGSFIAGPSKTADIEQSLVIGAHGPRSMTVFVLQA
jgi:L-lactate dehydrogenase complex protein LldG